jgi:hypothetical protein
LYTKSIFRKLSSCALLLSLFLLLFCKAFAAFAAPPKSGKWKISVKQQSFLESVERDTFNFFWETVNRENGLTPDRFPDAEISSVAGVGFALTAYVVGVARGYITRSQAAERTLTTLKFLRRAPQGPERNDVAGYKGFFYHFLNMGEGSRSAGAELSTIDTALLMAGVLSAETYFDGDTQAERKIRDYAEALYRRVDWPWAYSRWHRPLIGMGWLPESSFIPHSWRGYNEAMILYILALASPTHPIDRAAWDKWTSTYEWDTFYGYPHVTFGPLFGHQYSHIWIDFRNIQDKYMHAKGIDYFVNSRRATFANRAYCIDNPKKWRGYNDLLWGLTASDGPVEGRRKKGDFHSYWARGCSAGYIRDDGTIAPTAAGGSVAFAPEIAVPTLEHMYENLGDRAYGKYGFKDAFNLSYRRGSSGSQGWFGSNYLAIDQGPILLMIENYRSGLVWNLMKRNVHIKSGLRRAGFSGGWLDSVQSPIYSPALARDHGRVSSFKEIND